MQPEKLTVQTVGSLANMTQIPVPFYLSSLTKGWCRDTQGSHTQDSRLSPVIVTSVHSTVSPVRLTECRLYVCEEAINIRRTVTPKLEPNNPYLWPN